jgi:hypothetical protein
MLGVDVDGAAEHMRTQISLPLSVGGMGIRPLARTSHAAYLAAGMLAITDLINTAPPDSASRWPTHPLCINMQACVDQLVAQGVDVAKTCAHGLLDHPIATLWTRMSSLLIGPTADEVRSYVQSGLQHTLTTGVEAVLLSRLHHTLPLADRTRLVALSTEHAARALTVLPTEKCFQLHPDEVRSLVRMRLGMQPDDALTHTQCVCKAYKPFQYNPAHLHCCPVLKGTGVTLRHNLILSALAAYCQLCGCSTLKEPSSLATRVRTAAHVRRTTPLTEHVDHDDEDTSDSDLEDGAGAGATPTAASPGPDTWQPGMGVTQQVARRADLLISHPQHFGYADVSVAHPATSTLLSRTADPPVANTPLVAAKAREVAKMRIYEDCPAYDGYEVTPFVLETHGGFGPQAVSFLRRLAATTDTPARTLERGMDMLAVALVKGNRVIEHVAIPKLRQVLHSRRDMTRTHPPIRPQPSGSHLHEAAPRAPHPVTGSPLEPTHTLTHLTPNPPSAPIPTPAHADASRELVPPPSTPPQAVESPSAAGEGHAHNTAVPAPTRTLPQPNATQNHSPETIDEAAVTHAMAPMGSFSTPPPPSPVVLPVPMTLGSHTPTTRVTDTPTHTHAATVTHDVCNTLAHAVAPPSLPAPVGDSVHPSRVAPQPNTATLTHTHMSNPPQATAYKHTPPMAPLNHAVHAAPAVVPLPVTQPRGPVVHPQRLAMVPVAPHSNPTCADLDRTPRTHTPSVHVIHPPCVRRGPLVHPDRVVQLERGGAFPGRAAVVAHAPPPSSTLHSPAHGFTHRSDTRIHIDCVRWPPIDMTHSSPRGHGSLVHAPTHTSTLHATQCTYPNPLPNPSLHLLAHPSRPLSRSFRAPAFSPPCAVSHPTAVQATTYTVMVNTDSNAKSRTRADSLSGCSGGTLASRTRTARRTSGA